MSSEKAAAGISSTATSIRTTAAMTPAMSTPRIVLEPIIQQQHGSIIGAAVQNLRARSIKYRKTTQGTRQQQEQSPSKGEQQPASASSVNEPIYMEPIFATDKPQPINGGATTTKPTTMTATATTVTLEDDDDDDDDNQDNNNLPSGPYMRTSRSMSTNTPALILRGDMEKTKVDIHTEFVGAAEDARAGQSMYDIETAERQLPIKPPRKKTSRSTSPVGVYFMEIVGVDATGATGGDGVGGVGGERGTTTKRIVDDVDADGGAGAGSSIVNVSVLIACFNFVAPLLLGQVNGVINLGCICISVLTIVLNVA